MRTRAVLSFPAAAIYNKSTGVAGLTVNSILKCEIIVPNDIFQYKVLRPLPVLITPLFTSLISSSKNNNNNNNSHHQNNSTVEQKQQLHQPVMGANSIPPPPLAMTMQSSSLTAEMSLSDENTGIDSNQPIFGYLTLNQTRKVVFLHEKDANIHLLPLVGVWINMGGLGGSGGVRGGRRRDSKEEMNNTDKFARDGIYTAKNAMYHPLVWAACVRFCHNSSEVRERALVASGTFLVVSMTFLLFIKLLCLLYCYLIHFHSCQKLLK